MTSPVNLDVQAASSLTSNPFAGGGSGMFGPQSFSFGGSGAGSFASANASSGFSLGKFTPWIVGGAVLMIGLYIYKHRR